jgi:hypothetical protein
MKVALIACGLCLALVACADVPARSSVPTARADGDAHVAIRAEGGRLWWSHRPWSEPHPLWTLPAHGPVEELDVRAIASDSDDQVFVVSFRQDGRWFHGRFSLDGTSAIEVPGAFLDDDHDSGNVALVTDLARDGR